MTTALNNVLFDVPFNLIQYNKVVDKRDCPSLKLYKILILKLASKCIYDLYEQES